MIRDIQTHQDLNELLESSQDKPVLLLKHSTRCPISSAAWRVFQGYDASHPGAALYRVLVIEQRALSQQVAEQTGIVHQSPQAMLFQKGEVAWHASHYSITADALEAAVGEASGA